MTWNVIDRIKQNPKRRWSILYGWYRCLFCLRTVLSCGSKESRNGKWLGVKVFTARLCLFITALHRDHIAVCYCDFRPEIRSKSDIVQSKLIIGNLGSLPLTFGLCDRRDARVFGATD